jgi:hypothetical protein
LYCIYCIPVLYKTPLHKFTYTHRS